MDRPCTTSDDRKNDTMLALDWAALGRSVRMRTLDAIARHFAAQGAAVERVVAAPESEEGDA